MLAVPPVAGPSTGGLGYVATRNTKRALGPHKLRITNSDGDAGRWPTQADLTPTPRAMDGKLCYFVEFGTTSDRHQSWLKSIGQSLAVKLDLIVNEGEKWHLEDLPANYKLYEHHMGSRTDPYCFGACRDSLE